MNNRRTTKLFFVELLFVLFSFALCCAACVQLFVRAHEKSSSSREIAAAVASAQSAAECFKAVPNDEMKLASLLNAHMNNGTATVHYNADWEAVQDNSDRVLTLITHRDGPLITADITVSKGGRILFALTVCRASPDGGSAP